MSNEIRIVNCSEQMEENICSQRDDEEMVYKLDNLSSFTSYKIYVTAHTVLDSTPSNDVHVFTLIGSKWPKNCLLFCNNFSNVCLLHICSSFESTKYERNESQHIPMDETRSASGT